LKRRRVVVIAGASVLAAVGYALARRWRIVAIVATAVMITVMLLDRRRRWRWSRFARYRER